MVLSEGSEWLEFLSWPFYFASAPCYSLWRLDISSEYLLTLFPLQRFDVPFLEILFSFFCVFLESLQIFTEREIVLHSYFLPAMQLTNRLHLLAITASFGVSQAAVLHERGCNQDNCLRALLAPINSGATFVAHTQRRRIQQRLVCPLF